MRFSGSLKRWVEKRVGIFKITPAALDNQFRSLMFKLYMFCRVQGFIEFSIKAETKLKPTAWKTRPKKTCLAFEDALLVSHLPYFLFCCGCFFWGGRWGVGSGVRMGVWLFSWCLVDWKVVKRACCLEKKQSFVNSVIEILLKVKNNHRSKFFFEILLIRNSNFTLLLKCLETLLFRLI